MKHGPVHKRKHTLKSQTFILNCQTLPRPYGLFVCFKLVQLCQTRPLSVELRPCLDQPGSPQLLCSSGRNWDVHVANHLLESRVKPHGGWHFLLQCQQTNMQRWVWRPLQVSPHHLLSRTLGTKLSLLTCNPPPPPPHFPWSNSSTCSSRSTQRSSWP